MIRSAEIAQLGRRFPEFGIAAVPVIPDFKAVFDRKDRIVESLSGGEQSLAEQGVDFLHTRARFTSPHRVITDNGEIEAAKFIIASGSVPSVPSIPGLARTGYWTSDDALFPKRQPRQMIIIGGSAVGCELAQIYARLGTAVTIIEMLPQLIGNEDPEIAAILREAFLAENIEIILGAAVTHVSGAADGGKTVRYEADGRSAVISTDEILVATGRRPQLEGLNLPAAGIEANDGMLAVDSWLRTSQPHIWACGDVTGEPMLAHIASCEGEIAGHNATTEKPNWQQADFRTVPRAVFTDPPIASVGVSEAAARARGHDVVVGRYPYSELGRAVAMGETWGTVKLVADRQTGKLLGGSIIGAGADMLIHEAVIAIGSDLKVDALARPRALHIHPTISEAAGWAAGEMKETMLALRKTG